jgi:cyclopropane-fatty-acyl-phospholipid synthase
MASQRDIERTYDYLDGLLRRGLGEFPDLSCALYDGDYSLTLEKAQQAKHEYVLSSIRFIPNMRVLDIGCGWGPILRTVRDKGGHGIGVTLSPSQVRACVRNGLEAHLKDWRDMNVADYGSFDAIVSLGAFEHFCSAEEYLAGRQDGIYQQFFSLCHDLLPPGGRLYVQTMVWDRHVSYEAISLDAPKGSDAHVMALLEKFYPGSWLPYGREQICRNATGFRLTSSNSGRLDYIQTIKEWERRKIWRKALHPRSLPALAMRYATNRDFRYQVASLRQSCNRVCFERQIMDHQRMVFVRA